MKSTQEKRIHHFFFPLLLFAAYEQQTFSDPLFIRSFIRHDNENVDGRQRRQMCATNIFHSI